MFYCVGVSFEKHDFISTAFSVVSEIRVYVNAPSTSALTLPTEYHFYEYTYTHTVAIDV